ncbi:unnamed protein product [Thlaspi arvense]|uniref:Uncharacterized protein n=1 Tax=Thlaspi arvense TaxID=13288 RepID=A0AAU9RD90_THLAR|nr:unnamed protein product [Thlaspi arvense]
MVRTPCCKAELGLKKGAWTPEEDQKLTSYVNRHGEGGWRTLPEKAARGLPGRTDNEIKNYWNTHIKKRLIKKGVDPVTHKSLISGTGKAGNVSEAPEKQNVIQTITSADDLDNDHNAKNNNKKSGLSSAGFLNRVANRFGKRINQSVLSEIIGSGGPLTTNSHSTTTTSVSVDSESDKSTSSSFTPTSNLPCQMAVDGNGNVTPSSSMLSDSSVNDPLMYCNSDDNIGFSRLLSDEDFMMLEESTVGNTEFMKELTRFLQEDENDVTEVTALYEHEDIFQEIDNYFA